MNRQRDTCFHCPCGIFRHRDSKEARRHARHCLKARKPDTEANTTTTRTLRSNHHHIHVLPTRRSGPGATNHREQQRNHPNARMEALANAASAARSSGHHMLTRRTAASSFTSTTPGLLQHVASLVAADSNHQELRQQNLLRFSFDVLQTNRRVVTIHIALHSSMMDVLTMARIITRACDSVPGGGVPGSIRIWRRRSSSST